MHFKEKTLYSKKPYTHNFSEIHILCKTRHNSHPCNFSLEKFDFRSTNPFIHSTRTEWELPCILGVQWRRHREEGENLPPFGKATTLQSMSGTTSNPLQRWLQMAQKYKTPWPWFGGKAHRYELMDPCVYTESEVLYNGKPVQHQRTSEDEVCSIQ